MPTFAVYAARLSQLDGDPQGQGRVKVLLPPTLAPAGLELWARVLRPFGGATVGALGAPGDSVLVAFQGGDLNQPVVLGALSGGEGPPAPAPKRRVKGVVQIPRMTLSKGKPPR